MKEIDLKYVCKNICHLSGIPTRLYFDNTLQETYTMVNLTIDPIKQVEEDLLKITRHIEYLITPIFHYYGVVVFGRYKMIIGPTRQLKVDNQTIKELAFFLNIPDEDINEFISSLQSIPIMPLQNFTQMLCIINYILNDEKLSTGDIYINDNLQADFEKMLEEARLERNYDEISEDDTDVHNTFAFEQTMLNYVRKGDIIAVKKMFAESAAGRAGKLSSDFIRQQKNMFVVTVTLVCRAAIRGGMIADDAFALSDAYVQHCELMNNIDSIQNLQYHMIFDYTEKVNKLTNGVATSQLVIDIKNYIEKHLSESIKIEDIAKTLYISRGYLSVRFKEETGIPLNEFILKEKIEEAKRLLTLTDKSLAAISNYLGFSSQSHFQNIFKKFTQLTPKEYRETRHPL